MVEEWKHRMGFMKAHYFSEKCDSGCPVEILERIMLQLPPQSRSLAAMMSTIDTGSSNEIKSMHLASRRFVLF